VLIVSTGMANGGALRRLADKLRLAFQSFLEFCRFSPAVRHYEPALPFGFVAGVFRSLLALSDASRIFVVLTHLDMVPKIEARALEGNRGTELPRPPAGYATSRPNNLPVNWYLVG